MDHCMYMWCVACSKSSSVICWGHAISFIAICLIITQTQNALCEGYHTRKKMLILVSTDMDAYPEEVKEKARQAKCGEEQWKRGTGSRQGHRRASQTVRLICRLQRQPVVIHLHIWCHVRSDTSCGSGFAVTAYTQHPSVWWRCLRVYCQVQGSSTAQSCSNS